MDLMAIILNNYGKNSSTIQVENAYYGYQSISTEGIKFEQGLHLNL